MTRFVDVTPRPLAAHALPRIKARDEHQARLHLANLGDLRSSLVRGATTDECRRVLNAAIDSYKAALDFHHDFWRPTPELAARHRDALATSLGTTVLAASRLENPRAWHGEFGSITDRMIARIKSTGAPLLRDGQLPVALGTYHTEKFHFPFDGTYNGHLYKLFVSGFALWNLEIPASSFTPEFNLGSAQSALAAKAEAFETRWFIPSTSGANPEIMVEGITQGLGIYTALCLFLAENTRPIPTIPLAKAIVTLIDLIVTYMQIQSAHQAPDPRIGVMQKHMNLILSDLEALNEAATFRKQFREVVRNMHRGDLWLDRVRTWNIDIQALQKV